MTVDFNAEFDLGAGFESAETSCAQLSEEPPGLRETVARYRDRWRVSEWTVQRCRAHAAFDAIVGPGGFALALSSRVASMYHVMGFSTFTSDAEQRALLRGSCAVIATLLGSSRALLMPELTPTGFFDDLDLGAIEAKLRSEIGPPAATWKELHQAERFAPRSWYIDDFADLRRGPSA